MSIVDNHEEIRRRMEEIKAEFQEAITGTSAPSQEAVFEVGSLAHPEWPYAGTGFEWRRFVRS
jgi:hypothetical protein